MNLFRGNSSVVNYAKMDKGYKILKVEVFTQEVLEKMNELQELFAMETDPLIIIARYYKWSVTRMQNWFSEPENKRFELGIEFD